MADNDVFRMLATEDKLDGTNYPLWAYMMCHVLVAKGLWNIVQQYDVHLVVARMSNDDVGAVEDVVGSSLLARLVPPPPPPLAESKFVGMAEMHRHMHCLLCLLSTISSHTFTYVRQQKRLGMPLLPCIKQRMRQAPLTSKNSWRVST